MKMQDVKLTDQFAAHENAGHENFGCDILLERIIPLTRVVLRMTYLSELSR